MDVTTGTVYATPGSSGLAGGDGAGGDPSYTVPSGNVALSSVLKYKASTGAYDEDGKLWPGAPTKENGSGIAWYKSPWSSTAQGALSGYALGPGGVAGVTQSEPTQQGTYNSPYASATALSGLTPPAPSATPRQASVTKGGRGGYGGGGGSCPSWAGAEVEPRNSNRTPSVTAGSAGAGGPGGQGGRGGNGMIILYY